MGRRVALVALGAVLVAGCAAPGEDDLIVAAASSLRAHLDQAVTQWELDGGAPVTVVYGSSAQLSHQRAEGAPYDVVMVADAQLLSEADREASRTFGEGTLVVWSPQGTLRIEDLGGADRIVIANPDHAPFGRAAREALEDAGLWDRLADRLIYAASESQATVLAHSGDVDAALVAPTSVDRAERQDVDRATYQPLCQVLVIDESAGTAARDFGDFWVAFLSAQREATGEVSPGRCGP